MPFSVRLGYLIWLKHLADGRAPTFQAVGDAVSRSGVTVSAWLEADEAPPDYRVHEPLAEFFGVDVRWIVRGEGDPPRPELWEAWVKARRRHIKEAPPIGEQPRSTAAAKRRAK